MISLRAGAATDVGLVRANNQDQLLVADRLYAVADGMGGHAAGEVASAVAIEALDHGFVRSGSLTPDNLIEAARTANRAVWEEAEANPEMRGMGTTLVALAQVEGDQLAIVNIGDSRLYAFHDGELRQVTLDHNLVAELVAQGRISKEEAEFHPRRNIMTRALGVEPEVPVDLFVEPARPGDRYLLCSDGLPREVSDDLIAAILRRLADPQQAAKELVNEAKNRGGNDNITVVIVNVTEDSGVGEDTQLADVVEPAEAKVEKAPAKTGRRFRRRPRPPTASPVTLRVVAFILVLLMILGLGAFGVVWYARSGYFVGLQGSKIVIYQGRPGGVLWMKPTLKEATSHTTSDVLSVHLQSLQDGQQEPSLAAARAFVQRLVAERQEILGTGSPPTSAPNTATASTG
ncbi:MAG: Stp1/IreP family PP2C-type Ser/Thr phosphatase [Acidimicrobiales bacterium]|nr:Stp1/IreP family PP2C-type Ser/Thr phosphatase [Acidimicrobiales bacterium]